MTVRGILAALLAVMLGSKGTLADFCTAYAPMEGSRFTYPKKTCLTPEFMNAEFQGGNFGMEPIRLATELRNLSYQVDQGEVYSFPLALEASWGWESGHAVTAVVDILLREVLGMSTEFVCTWGSSHALRLLGGCNNPMGSDVCTDDSGQPQLAVPLAQASIETWVTTAQENNDMLLYGSNLGMVGYQSKSGLFFDATIATEAFHDTGLSLEWWQVYTTKGASMYFDSYLSISDSVRKWSNNATEAMCLPGTPAYDALQAKGYSCTDGWFFAPSCEHDKESCIPVILAEYSWNALDWIEAAVLHGYRFAITWIGAQYSAAYGVRSGKRMLFYCPTVTAVCSEKPLAKLFGDDHSPQGRPDYVTRLLKVVWRKLQQVDEQVYKFIQRINFPTEDLTALMAAYSDKMASSLHAGMALDELVQEIACEWIKNSMRVNDTRGMDTGDNTRKWGLWIPRTCSPGEAYDEASGQCRKCRLGEQSPDGVKCVPCSQGMFADEPGMANCKACGLGSWQDGSDRSKCKACQAGQQRNENDQGCQACSPGYVASEAGMAACLPCPLGTYASGRGFSACIACTAKMITPREASSSWADCECAPAEYLPCAKGLDMEACSADSVNNLSECQACPEGFTCPGGKEAVEGSLMHSQPVLDKGFYATSMEPYQAYMCVEAGHFCPGGKAASCDGGRHGLQCHACEAGFFGEVGSPCEACDMSKLSLSPLVIVAGFIALTLVYRIANGGRAKALGNVPLVAYLGLVSTYTQLFAVMLSISIEWPDAFAWLLRSLQIFVLDVKLLAPACYLGSGGLAAKYIPGVLTPVVIASMLLLMMAVAHVLAKRTSRVSPMQPNKVFNTFGVVLMGLYVAVVKSTVNLFEGRTNPSAPATLRAYDGFLYYSDEMVSLVPVAVLGILVYMVGFASLYIYVIVRAPVLYQEGSDFKQRFGFLLNRWHPRTYYWGVIFLSRNILCSLVPSMTTDPILQLMLLIAVVVCTFMAQVRYWPWRESMSNKMDCMFNMALLVTLISALALQGPSSSPVVETGIGAMSLASYLFAVFGTFFIVAKVAIRAGFCSRAAPADVGRVSRLSLGARSFAGSNSSGGLPVILGQDARMSKRLSTGSDALTVGQTETLTIGKRMSFIASLTMDTVSVQQQGASDVVQILQRLQESYTLAENDNDRLTQLLEKLAGEMPEEDLQRLQWALSTLGYHLLGDKTLRPSGIMLAPIVQRADIAEQASDPSGEDQNVVEVQAPDHGSDDGQETGVSV
eukprot:TRINITY_DN1128_c0_g1_i8.p1 TRINITY_DN1128_c0_g1~~TRINITY_DN1128_c0_g1_i8.p1  ORF type:complete len:1253 (+),score=250.76 TRINITY_DN1128_c0_g1_i8:76-3834(+)